MADDTKIEWTDATLNVVTGCTEVSPGCDNCYARTFAERWRGVPGHHFENGFDLQLRPERLMLPFTWKRPRKVFVNSMSDLFHKDVPDPYIAKVFAVMSLTPQHSYQVLTKRHGRMESLLNSEPFVEEVRRQIDVVRAALPASKTGEGFAPAADFQWPLPGVWLGVSIENQKWADIRIPALARTPAAVRFLSAEPLLGEIVLNRGHAVCPTHDFAGGFCSGYCPDQVWPNWIITGGESGHGARPAHQDWFRGLRDQCQQLGIAYLHKQNGAWIPAPSNYGPDVPARARPNSQLVFARKSDIDGQIMLHVGKGRAGRELDGREHNGFPAVDQ